MFTLYLVWTSEFGIEITERDRFRAHDHVKALRSLNAYRAIPIHVSLYEFTPTQLYDTGIIIEDEEPF